MNPSWTKNQIQELLCKWINAECYRVAESSGNMREDYIKIQNEVKEYCKTFNIEYNDSLFDDHVIDCINNYGFPDED